MLLIGNTFYTKYDVDTMLVGTTLFAMDIVSVFDRTLDSILC